VRGTRWDRPPTETDMTLQERQAAPCRVVIQLRTGSGRAEPCRFWIRRRPAGARLAGSALPSKETFGFRKASGRWRTSG